MTHDPVLHALVDLVEAIRKGPSDLEPAYGQALKVIREHVAPGGERHAYVSREAIIEEVATKIERAPLTYSGPDPVGVRNLHFLVVAAIRDMKKEK